MGWKPVRSGAKITGVAQMRQGGCTGCKSRRSIKTAWISTEHQHESVCIARLSKPFHMSLCLTSPFGTHRPPPPPLSISALFLLKTTCHVQTCFAFLRFRRLICWPEGFLQRLGDNQGALSDSSSCVHFLNCWEAKISLTWLVCYSDSFNKYIACYLIANLTCAVIHRNPTWKLVRSRMEISNQKLIALIKLSISFPKKINSWISALFGFTKVRSAKTTLF